MALNRKSIRVNGSELEKSDVYGVEPEKWPR